MVAVRLLRNSSTLFLLPFLSVCPSITEGDIHSEEEDFSDGLRTFPPASLTRFWQNPQCFEKADINEVRGGLLFVCWEVFFPLPSSRPNASPYLLLPSLPAFLTYTRWR